MLIALGVDFRHADVRTRERFLPSPDRGRLAASELGSGPLREIAFLPTCNRVELYAWSPDARDRATALKAMARCWTGDRKLAAELLRVGTVRHDADAALHLLRVAGGLESQVLGDIHILGQVRRAFREAAAAGTLGPHLHRLFETALRCGKGVKRDTSLMAGSSSVGSEAARFLLSRMTDGRRPRIAVLGTGKIGTHAARTMDREGSASIVLLNRTRTRAEELATSLDGAVQVGDFARLHAVLAEVDGVIVATGAPTPILDAPRLHAARAEGGTAGHPLVILDASMPRNTDPRCGQIPGVALLDLDDLGPGIAARMAARQGAVPEAEAVVREHLADFQSWCSDAEAREALRPLRDALVELCEREVGFHAGPEVAQRASGRIVAKLLAGPMSTLRSASRRGEPVDSYAQAVRLLFGGSDPRLQAGLEAGD